ncbi:LysR substrate-binding domain-containing protein [Aliiroseovarius subalbicans]
MIAPRRDLPSISSLLALEAVDRLGGASAAAEELSLTQGAISRQLKALEAQMGVALIERSGVRLALTPVGADYVSEARRALHLLAQASSTLRDAPSGGVLNLSILPAFGMHWLAPRLRDFARAHPEVTVNLTTRLRPFDFATEPFHAAIHFGRRDWPGVGYLPLMEEEMVPVCAPDLTGGHAVTPDALLNLPLLNLESRARAWQHWFAGQGRDVARPPGMVFDQFATMIQAAIHGAGVGLAPTFLVQSELSAGSLIIAAEGPAAHLGTYYLVWPDTRADHPPLVHFRNWIASA